MKIMFISDIHGSYTNLEKAFEFFLNEEIDKMIVLGDTFLNQYSLTESDKLIADLFWKIKNKIIIIKGNCDLIDNSVVLPVIPIDNIIIEANNKKIMCNHGHMPAIYHDDISIYASGHTHVAKIDKINNKYYINPGSIGRPRDGLGGSFIILSKNNITLFDLNYNVIEETFF